jgi:threonine synthase
MDISKASNFERFVFDLLARDGARTADLFGMQVQRQGRFELGSDPAFALAAGRYGFASGKSTHQDRLNTIRATWEKYGVVVDTHTADGLKVAQEHRQAGVPMLVLETALPIKFAATIVEALGREPDRPAKFEGIEALPKKVHVMAPDVQAIKTLIAQACDGVAAP